jgi:Holliday junction resolvasome RuvABC endonuclease subunit
MEHSGLGRYSWKPAVLGLDLSLASTGYALDVVRSGLFIDMEVGRIRSKLKGAERLIEIRDEVRDLITRADLVVLEGYAYARANQAHQIGELGGVIRVLLKEQSKPNLIVAPKTVKKWATGSGNAGKPEMVDAAWKQLGYLGKSSDEADALWLHHLGTGAFDPQHPSVRLDEFRSAWVQDLDTPDVSI